MRANPHALPSQPHPVENRLPQPADSLDAAPESAERPVPPAGASAPEPVTASPHARPSKLRKVQSTLTLLQANLLVAILGGFRARKSDGHPGPDIMARGLHKLYTLVDWERMKKELARKRSPPGRRSRPERRATSPASRN